MWAKKWSGIVDIRISPAIVARKREQVVVDWIPPEGIDHWMFKIAAVKMLMIFGYNRNDIFVE